ncbi:Peroxisomal membrane protein PMP27 [Elasticomyces elasticus]|nr:Peroxisomal membrane protein PMP27 [Elasticomyces elasticus]
MVADALIYHPVVSHYNRFVATTVGRDKTLRTIQYFSRFLAWYTYRTNSPAATVAFFEAIKKNFGSVRKAMRLGKFVEHFKAAAVASDAKSGSIDPVVKYLAVGRQLGYAFYMMLDNLAYFDQCGIKKFEGAARMQREASRAWLVGLSCNIVAGTYQLYNLRVAARKQRDSQDAEKAVEAKKLERCVYRRAEVVEVLTRHDRDQRATQLQLISDICDSIVPSAALGLVNFDDGIVGLAGTTSSLIGLFAAWQKTA